MYYIGRTVAVLALLALALAGWWSVRSARADAAFRSQDFEHAMALAPGNASYVYTSALQAEYAGRDSTKMLERDAAMSPVSSAPRVRLGLAAEIRGDVTGAERWLLDAAAVDRQFETQWAVANFYFRQGRRDEFWKWIRSALEMSYGDRRAAFQLCWRMSDDPAEILSRAIPQRREVVAAYLYYLLEQKRSEAVAPAAAKLASIRTTDDLPVLYAACDALLSASFSADAAQLWQLLGQAPPGGVTNPDFETTPIGHGFDWRIIDQPGVVQTELSSPHGHRIRFDGRQPESAELLRQVLGGLRSGATYTLRWEARTRDVHSATGVEWRIAGDTAAVAASEDWAGGELRFKADGDHPVLVLAYRRPPGEVRTEGTLDLRNVVVEESDNRRR